VHFNTIIPLQIYIEKDLFRILFESNTEHLLKLFWFHFQNNNTISNIHFTRKTPAVFF
jgi:hypothetical protein